MADEAAPKAAPEEVVGAEEEDGQDIFYVCKKTLEAVKEKLKKEEEITEEIVNELTFPENLADEEIMVPVDMRGVGQDFEDVEQMVEKLGPKGTAEAFVKAAEYFEANKDGEKEEDRPQPMTAAQWRKVLEEDEEDMLEGEEEEAELDEELEEEAAEAAEAADEAAEEAGEGAEPPAKKAKTE